MKLILLKSINNSWVESTADPRNYPHLPGDKIPFKSLIIEAKTEDGEDVAIILPAGMKTTLAAISSKWDKVISQLAELEGLKEEIERISSPSSKSK